MDHAAHQPGTVAECPECREVSYEPGWYRALRDRRVGADETIEDANLLMIEEEALTIYLPALETISPRER
jgi:hypothetical protein